MDREWELRAVCRSYDPDIWFGKATAAAAQQLCMQCPVRDECLEAILARESQTADTLRAGIIAGLTGAQRAAVAADRRSQLPAAAKRKAPPGAGRPPAPCGTKSAYNRHIRKGEPVDEACRAANNRAATEYRATGTTKVPAGR